MYFAFMDRENDPDIRSFPKPIEAPVDAIDAAMAAVNRGTNIQRSCYSSTI